MPRVDPGFGLCLFTTCSIDTLAPIGETELDSAYSQAGPGPGTPIPADESSRWRPTLTGAQSVDLSVVTIHGGYAGLDGARVVYRLLTDTLDREYRGWNEPNLPTQWTAPNSGWGAAATFAFPAAAPLPSGRVAVMAPDDTLTTAGRSWHYDPRTETWTNGLDWSTGPGIGLPVALGYDAGSGRLLAWTGSGDVGEPSCRAYSSTDEGVTWQLYARGMWPSEVVSTDRIRVAIDPGGADWLAVLQDQHCVSSDRGVTWRFVETLTGGSGSVPYVPIRTQTGWLIAFIQTGTNQPCVRALPSPGSSFANFDDVVVSDIVAADIVGCCDADGVVYLLTRGTAGATTRHVLTVHRSTDGGLTWTDYAWQPSLGADARVVGLQDLVATNGQLHLVYTQAGGAATGVNGTVALMSFGGWSMVEAGSGLLQAIPQNRMSYGNFGDATAPIGQLWVPFATPEDMGWTAVTSTGTRSFDGAQVGLEIVTILGQAEIYERVPNLAVVGFTSGEAVLRLTAGSASLATIGTANTGVFLQPVLGNAGSTLLYEPRIDVGSDGIQVRDGSTIRATVAISTVTSAIHIRWALRRGGITVWYRKAATDHAEAWTRFANDVVVTDTGGSQAIGLRWGHGAGAAGIATWRMVGCAGGGDFLTGIDSAGQAKLDSGDGVRGLRWGRAVPGAGAVGYPLPEATEAGEDVGRIVATGWAPEADFQTLPVAYEYGIQNIDPESSPSPRATWKAASDVDQFLVFDNASVFSDAVWHGGAVALVVRNATTPSVTVELDDGGGAYDTPVVCSMELLANWDYDLVGRVATTATGSPTLSRYVGEGELKGCWGLFESSTIPKFRRIATNSGGYLTSDATKQQCRISLAADGEDGGIDGTELPAGTATLYHHSATHIVYPADDTPRRYLRLTVAAVGGGGVPSAGILRPARVVGIGTPAAFAWTRSLELARVLKRAADGTPTVRRLGPPRQVWSYPMTDGVDMQSVRLLSTVTPFVGAFGGMPIGTRGDGWLMMWGLIEHSLRSGEVPCVLVPKLPAVSGVLMDPTSSIYGLLAADSISVSSVVGREGIDEWVRLDSPTIEEIR